MFVDVFGGLRTCAKSKSVPRMGSYLITIAFPAVPHNPTCKSNYHS